MRELDRSCDELIFIQLLGLVMFDSLSKWNFQTIHHIIYLRNNIQKLVKTRKSHNLEQDKLSVFLVSRLTSSAISNVFIVLKSSFPNNLKTHMSCTDWQKSFDDRLKYGCCSYQSIKKKKMNPDYVPKSINSPNPPHDSANNIFTCLCLQ